MWKRVWWSSYAVAVGAGNVTVVVGAAAVVAVVALDAAVADTVGL